MAKNYNYLMISANQVLDINGGSLCSFREQPSNRPHLHTDFMEICYVTGGEGQYNHGGEVYRLREGSLFLSHPGVIHEISSWETRNLELFFVTVTDFSAEKGQSSRLAVCRPNCFPLGEYLPLMVRHGRRPTAGTALAREGFAREALEQLDLNRGESQQSVPLPQDLRRIADYIEDHIDLALTVEEIASRFALSERTLRRRFRETVGLGLKQFILQRKMERAGNLLMMHWRVNEAARAVGIGDPAQFSRTFKAAKGASPREWQSRFVEKTGATLFL